MEFLIRTVSNMNIKKDIMGELDTELEKDIKLENELKTMDLKLRCIKTKKSINFDELNHNLDKSESNE
jgi:CRISPR/Cas system-associated protein Cas7 (RAMP superfamily)